MCNGHTPFIFLPSLVSTGVLFVSTLGEQILRFSTFEKESYFPFTVALDRQINLYPLPKAQSRPHPFRQLSSLVHVVYCSCTTLCSGTPGIERALGVSCVKSLLKFKQSARKTARRGKGYHITPYGSWIRRTVRPALLWARGTHAVGPAVKGPCAFQRKETSNEANTADPTSCFPLDGSPSRYRLWNGRHETTYIVPFCVCSCSGRWRVHCTLQVVVSWQR